MLRDWGKTLDSNTVEQGLRELNRDIHFDMGTKLNQWHPMQESRQGVFYRGTHICSMDRGVIPEYKIWSLKEVASPVPLSEIDNEDVSIRYEVVPTNIEHYFDLYNEVLAGKHEGLQIRADGHMVQLVAYKVQKVRHRVILVGWRHTFERMLKENIPGITRRTLSMKFGVDMLRWPQGPPEEVIEALTAE